MRLCPKATGCLLSGERSHLRNWRTEPHRNHPSQRSV
jgi:hypothetical protein